jgi:Malic enzyme, N-terminal domain
MVKHLPFERGWTDLAKPRVGSLGQVAREGSANSVARHETAAPRRQATDLQRYIYLIGLADRNETLFFRTVTSHPARFIPILYDPTVAEACLTFGAAYERYFSESSYASQCPGHGGDPEDHS